MTRLPLPLSSRLLYAVMARRRTHWWAMAAAVRCVCAHPAQAHAHHDDAAHCGWSTCDCSGYAPVSRWWSR